MDANGTISRDTAYTLAEFKARVKLGEWGLRQARRAGLRTVRVGRQTYVNGSDWLRFLEQRAERSGATR